MPGLVRYLFAALLLAAPAAHAANWLDDAWSDEAVDKAGAPAITLGASAVLLVLPAATLDEAHAQGVSTPEAVRLFLGRYGQHCSQPRSRPPASQSSRAALPAKAGAAGGCRRARAK